MQRFSNAEIKRLRSETPGCEGRIHLNNAGAALTPAIVLEAMTSHLQLEALLGGYEAADARAEAIESAYDSVAGLLGCARRNVALAENATAAYAQALSSIPFRQGDVILTSHEDYSSNQIMFLSLARRLGVRVVRAPSLPEGGADAGAMGRIIRRERPKLVALTHVPTNSGLVQPVAEIGRECRAAEVLYLLDACQSAGQMPLDVQAIGCDFLSATCRKFLRGPRGAGFLYVSDRVLEAGLEPLLPDMRGADWKGNDVYVARPTAARFENWEFNYALVLGTGEAARYATAVGLRAIAERTSPLAAGLRRRLAAAGLRCLDRGADLCGIVTVEVPGWEGLACRDELRRRGVNTSTTVPDFTESDSWALRLSPHYYNTEDEIESAVAAIVDLAGQA